MQPNEVVMREVECDVLRRAVESQHGGTAIFIQSVPVSETHNDKTVWEGVVHVFDLAGHPKATRAYAWSSPIEGSENVARQSGWESSDNQDGHFGGRGGEMIVAARR